jgi:hypothetical protein
MEFAIVWNAAVATASSHDIASHRNEPLSDANRESDAYGPVPVRSSRTTSVIGPCGL